LFLQLAHAEGLNFGHLTRCLWINGTEEFFIHGPLFPNGHQFNNWWPFFDLHPLQSEHPANPVQVDGEDASNQTEAGPDRSIDLVGLAFYSRPLNSLIIVTTFKNHFLPAQNNDHIAMWGISMTAYRDLCRILCVTGNHGLAISMWIIARAHTRGTPLFSEADCYHPSGFTVYCLLYD
jgi:hypothetical protein